MPQSAGSSLENLVLPFLSHLLSPLTSPPFYSKKNVGMLGFRHSALPSHLEGWQGAMAAMSLCMDTAAKGPFKRYALRTPALFSHCSSEEKTVSYFFLSLFLLYFSFSLSSLTPFISVKLLHKSCLHGISVPHRPSALTHCMAPWLTILQQSQTN